MGETGLALIFRAGGSVIISLWINVVKNDELQAARNEE